MFCANVLVGKPLRFFRGVGQNSLAFIAQREVDRSGNFLPDCGMSFNLLANGFDRGMRAQETIGQGFVFAQESQQQVFRLNIRRPELAGLIARKEDDAPGFLRIAFKHIALPPRALQGICRSRARDPIPRKPLALSSLCNRAANRATSRSRYLGASSPLPKTPELCFSASGCNCLQTSLAGKRLWHDLLDPPVLQPQNPVAAARKSKIVRGDQGSQLITAM